jgi:hypothetical protein
MFKGNNQHPPVSLTASSTQWRRGQLTRDYTAFFQRTPATGYYYGIEVTMQNPFSPTEAARAMVRAKSAANAPQ